MNSSTYVINCVVNVFEALWSFLMNIFGAFSAFIIWVVDTSSVIESSFQNHDWFTYKIY